VSCMIDLKVGVGRTTSKCKLRVTMTTTGRTYLVSEGFVKVKESKDQPKTGRERNMSAKEETMREWNSLRCG